MYSRTTFVAAAVACVGMVAGAAAAQEVSKPDVAGVRNFARLETTVACAGARRRPATSCPHRR